VKKAIVWQIEFTVRIVIMEIFTCTQELKYIKFQVVNFIYMLLLLAGIK